MKYVLISDAQKRAMVEQQLMQVEQQHYAVTLNLLTLADDDKANKESYQAQLKNLEATQKKLKTQYDELPEPEETTPSMNPGTQTITHPAPRAG